MPLDVVKSILEFDGKQEHYISWLQAANAAYKVFDAYDGSSRHYQAVAIIRNKVRGSADAILASFNTVLNFHAIIARLDFTYSDKTPVHVIQQDLSTLRQGDQPLLKNYDEIEIKLTLLTNKTLMTHENRKNLGIRGPKVRVKTPSKRATLPLSLRKIPITRKVTVKSRTLQVALDREPMEVDTSSRFR